MGFFIARSVLGAAMRFRAVRHASGSFLQWRVRVLRTRQHWREHLQGGIACLLPCE